jgi:hypothetical protein
MKLMVARSISRPVLERLSQERIEARLLAVFVHACNMVTRDGAVLALTTPHVGNGPLNVVVEGEAKCFYMLTPGDPATWEREQIIVGRMVVDLTEATPWEPRPDWDALQARRDTIRSCLPFLRAVCLRHAPEDSFLALLGASQGQDATLATAQKALAALEQGWDGDQEQLQQAGIKLAGLGGGLTPSGDDFMNGAMLWAWLAHPAPEQFCQALAQAAAPHTTSLSAAFLRVASRGECSAPWHALLAALSAGQEEQIAATAQGVLAHGASSGADLLAGFLWSQRCAESS